MRRIQQGAAFSEAAQAAKVRRRNRPAPIALRLVLGLALLVAVGTLLLWLSSLGSVHPLSASEALFTAVSALTVTGLSVVIVPARDLTLLGQIVLLVLIEIGGVGFMAVAVVVFRLIGRSVNLLDRMALRDSLGLPDLTSILRLVERVLQAVVVIQGSGALLLWLHWRVALRGTLTEGQTAFYAVFHAVSAFCNAGFDLFSGLPGPAGSGIPTDSMTLLILGTLIFLGGLGIPVLSDTLTYPRNRRLSLHTRITWGLSVALMVMGGIGLLLSETTPGGVLANLPWPRRVALSWFQSVSSRTAGFAGLPNFENLAPASQQIILMLMFIGCAPASMGGGITTGTFVVLVLALWGYARGLPAARLWGRRIPAETIRKAGAILTVSLVLTSVSIWLLLLTHRTTLDRAAFEVISAFATCGVSLAFTDELNGFGQGLILLLMFWGRLGALSLVVVLARPGPPDPIRYPEEQVLIG